MTFFFKGEGRFGVHRQAGVLRCTSGGEVLLVTEASGQQRCVHCRWACPKFLRQTFHEWAAQSIAQCDWAAAYYQVQREDMSEAPKNGAIMAPAEGATAPLVDGTGRVAREVRNAPALRDTTSLLQRFSIPSGTHRIEKEHRHEGIEHTAPQQSRRKPKRGPRNGLALVRVQKIAR